MQHSRLLQISQRGDHATAIEAAIMARELLAARTRIEMLKMDLERAIKLAESLQNGH